MPYPAVKFKQLSYGAHKLPVSMTTIKGQQTPVELDFNIPIPKSITLTIKGTVPGWAGVPGTITLSGADLYRTSIALFQAKGTIGNSCGDGERGGPIFSAKVDRGAEFYGAPILSGVPFISSGPFVNRKPCSSFFARKVDPQGNEKQWINGTGRAWSISSSGIIKDLEYQVRYYSGDPAKQYSDKTCVVGVVPNMEVSFSPVRSLTCSVALSYQ